MQIVAYGENGTLIFADQAVKGEDYRCIECNGIVRRRGGLHRRDHFFHAVGTSRCRLNGKSMNHLQVQYAIQQGLPIGEAVMEKQFPEIQRIADVCWEKERIIFEVQCSFIGKEEILARNFDYQSQGYVVVWILHDQRYNKKRASAAEAALQGSTFYYTNIDLNGDGKIYDQLSIINKGLRVRRFSRFDVNLSIPRRKENAVSLRKETLYFVGDTYDRFLKGEIHQQELESFLKAGEQNMHRKGLFFYLDSLLSSVSFWYRRLLRAVLEKSCQ